MNACNRRKKYELENASSTPVGSILPTPEVAPTSNVLPSGTSKSQLGIFWLVPAATPALTNVPAKDIGKDSTNEKKAVSVDEPPVMLISSPASSDRV